MASTGEPQTANYQTLTLQRYRRTNKCLHQELPGGDRLTLMLIPAGTFLMGAPEDEPESGDNERPQRQVSVESFLMGRYPVTQAQWRAVAGLPRQERDLEPDPSSFDGDNRPVENVDWDDAQEFCRRLSVETKKKFRLPSEAEWEYACRAGTETPFHFGPMLTAEVANFRATETYNGSPKGEWRQETTEVGQFPANRWGLHDMHGNVWEWCEDDYGSYAEAPTDGSARVKSDRSETGRVLRGGSWPFDPRNCRSAYRSFNFRRDSRPNYIGFRVCCDSPRTLGA